MDFLPTTENNDLLFPKETTHALAHFQKDVVEFVTSVILQHEKEFYLMIHQHFNGDFQKILGTIDNHLPQMIAEITSKFYNKIYLAIQNDEPLPAKKLVIGIAKHANYSVQHLVKKLLRFTFHIHSRIDRNKLVCDKNLQEYQESILKGINVQMSKMNFTQFFSRFQEDSDTMPYIPNGQTPFQIIIDKNIK